MSNLTILAGQLQQREVSHDLPADRIFVRDLVLDCAIGAYAEEHGVTQKVGFTVEATIDPSVRAIGDELASVPSYDDIVQVVRGLVAEGHIQLVETLAERIARRCLEDSRITAVMVRIEKLERGPAAVGVEIHRQRPRLTPGEVFRFPQAAE